MDSAIAQLIVKDPEILGGAPVFRGTRIPVLDVAASVRAGISMDRILAAYPALDIEKINAAISYSDLKP